MAAPDHRISYSFRQSVAFDTAIDWPTALASRSSSTTRRGDPNGSTCRASTDANTKRQGRHRAPASSVGPYAVIPLSRAAPSSEKSARPQYHL